MNIMMIHLTECVGNDKYCVWFLQGLSCAIAS